MFGNTSFSLPGALTPRGLLGSLSAAATGSHAAAYPGFPMPRAAPAPNVRSSLSSAHDGRFYYNVTDDADDARPQSADTRRTDSRMSAIEDHLSELAAGVRLMMASHTVAAAAPTPAAAPNRLNLAASGYNNYPEDAASARDDSRYRPTSAARGEPPAAHRESAADSAALRRPPPHSGEFRRQRGTVARVRDMADYDDSDEDGSSDREWGSVRLSRDRQRLLGDPLQSVNFAEDIFMRLGGGGVETLRQAVHQREWSNRKNRYEVEHNVNILRMLFASGARITDEAVEAIARRIGGLWHADVTGDAAMLTALETRPGNANASPFARGTLNYVFRSGDPSGTGQREYASPSGAFHPRGGAAGNRQPRNTDPPAAASAGTSAGDNWRPSAPAAFPRAPSPPSREPPAASAAASAPSTGASGTNPRGSGSVGARQPGRGSNNESQ